MRCGCRRSWRKRNELGGEGSSLRSGFRERGNLSGDAFRGQGKTKDAQRGKPSGKKRKPVDKELDEFHLFVRMFGFLIRDGYTPDKAVGLLVSTSKGGLGSAAREALVGVEQGMSLSDAFRATKYFPGEFCAVLAVGESSGSLGSSMEMYAEYVEKVLQMRKGFRSALTYPSVLISFVVVMAAVLLFVVAPGFVDSINQMGVDKDALPAVSGILFASHEFAQKVGLPAVVAFVLFVVYYLLFSSGKDHMVKVLGVVPKVREVNNKLNWAQWLMMGSICIKSGMLMSPMLGILESLPLPEELARKKLKGKRNYEVLKNNVASGRPLAAELEFAGAPTIIYQMMGAAEKSGRTGEAMSSVASQYLYSLPMDIKAIGTVVEQLAIALVVMVGGGMVAVVAITMASVSMSGI